MLDAAARDRVEAAVRRAEGGTAGEIVVVLTRQAASYASVPLLYGLVVSVLLPAILVSATALPAVRIVTVQALATLLTLLVGSAAGLRLVPHLLKRERARAAAAREFRNRGMADTRGRTGALLFVAEGERYAEVVGDVTIAARVQDSEWRAVVDPLLDGFRAGNREEALIGAVERLGEVLARHVPAGAADTDELPNRVVIL